ncbi:hypothetical protein Gpo141_00010919 [Globisporangium polare]
MGRAEAKKTPRTAVSDRLRATEEALKAAQATIAQQEKREKELRALLVTNGVAHEATQSAANPVVDAKMQAIKTIHEQKVRALMKSINQLQEQLQSLRAQDKEHRRSALIQSLRKNMREQELIIDVLKQTLAEKLPEFKDSRALVNDFVIKKTVGGPLRFRPKTREELEQEMDQLNEKYKRVLGNLRQAKRDASDAASSSKQKEEAEEKSQGGEDQFPEGNGDFSAPPQTVDPALQEELERLQVELNSKVITIHSQSDEINSLYAEIDKLRVVEDKLERKKHKVSLLEDKLAQQQLETVRLVHEKEVQAEKCVHLEEEIQFLRDNRVDDVSSRDQERLEQLELIQRLRASEIELQSQMEEQQRKWSTDRTAIHQQMRLLEKEKQLAEDEKTHAETERAAVLKKSGVLERKIHALEEHLEEAEAARRSLSSKVEDLESILAQHESMSREERDALAKSTAEKLEELQQSVIEKDVLVKSTERQLNAAKLLVRQCKKEKEQLQERMAKLQEELRSSSSTSSAAGQVDS